MKIRTHYDPPPITMRQFDWAAWMPGSYDISGVDETGQPYSNHPIGFGRTEAEAIADLKEQMEET